MVCQCVWVWVWVYRVLLWQGRGAGVVWHVLNERVKLTLLLCRLLALCCMKVWLTRWLVC